MRRLFYLLLGTITIFVAINLVWRWASRQRQLPCPAALAWLLDNPLTNLVAGTEVTLDRIGLRPGEHVLDVGCGPGRLTIPAARRVAPTGTVTAVDIQSQMLTRLKTRADRASIANIAFHLSNIASDQSLPANRFDRAWLVTVLGEIPDRLAALRNLYRVLKPGGTLSITEMFGDPHYQRRRVVLRLAQEVGFEPTQYWKSGLAFTQNFVKP